jgi:hypothetical protein
VFSTILLNSLKKYGIILFNAYYIKKQSIGFICRQWDNEIAGQTPARDESRPKSKGSLWQPIQKKKIYDRGKNQLNGG